MSLTPPTSTHQLWRRHTCQSRQDICTLAEWWLDYFHICPRPLDFVVNNILIALITRQTLYDVDDVSLPPPRVCVLHYKQPISCLGGTRSLIHAPSNFINYFRCHTLSNQMSFPLIRGKCKQVCQWRPTCGEDPRGAKKKWWSEWHLRGLIQRAGLICKSTSRSFHQQKAGACVRNSTWWRLSSGSPKLVWLVCESKMQICNYN